MPSQSGPNLEAGKKSIMHAGFAQNLQAQNEAEEAKQEGFYQRLAEATAAHNAANKQPPSYAYGDDNQPDFSNEYNAVLERAKQKEAADYASKIQQEQQPQQAAPKPAPEVYGAMDSSDDNMKALKRMQQGE